MELTNGSGIYMMFWPNNNYFYIGQSGNLLKRKSSHIGALIKGKHKNNKIQSIFNKYGVPEFKTLSICEPSLLNGVEQAFIDIHISNKNCCNLSPTAGSCRGYKMPKKSIETRNKLSVALKGRVFSIETRKKLSESVSGFRHTDEAKAKMKGQQLGKIVSESTRSKLSKALSGKPKSESHKVKIGVLKTGNTYRLGSKLSVVQISALSSIKKADIKNCKRFADLNISRRKKVSQIDMQSGTIVAIFDSITQAGNMGFDRKAISKCCRGLSNFSKGFKWSYYEAA